MSREKLLGQARADLVALPDLAAELARLVADRHHDTTGHRGKVIGSPAPLSLPIVHLVGGGTHRPAWWGEDPRQPRWALTWYRRANDEKTANTSVHTSEDAAWRAFHRMTGLPAPLELHQWAAVRVTPWRARDLYGGDKLLEVWVRKLWENMPEPLPPSPPSKDHPNNSKHRRKWGRPLPGIIELTEQPDVRSEAAVLLEHWSWITEQQWAEDLAEDVQATTNQIKAMLGIKPEPTYACPQCHNPAYLQPGGILACTEVPDHDVVVRDLEQQLRRRPALATRDICEEFDVEPGTLRIWKHRRKIKPARTEQHGRTERHWWLPWDVFCLVNPDIAEAFERRAEIEADDVAHA